MQNVRLLERLQMLNLKRAVFWGDLDEAESALKKLPKDKVPTLSTQIPIKGKDYQAMPILILAVMKKDKDRVNMLLRYGLDPNFSGDHLTPALPLAAYLRAPREIIKALLDAGANVHAKCVDGLTALHYLALLNDLRNIQLLKSFGCSLDIKSDPDQATALHIAAMVGGRSVAEYLVSHGVDVDAECLGEGTASTIARENSHTQLAEWLHSKSKNCKIVSNPSKNAMQKKVFVFDFKIMQRLSGGRELWTSNSYGEQMDPINMTNTFQELGYWVEIFENFKLYETKDQLAKIQRDKTPRSIILVFLQLAISKDRVNTADGQIFNLQAFQHMFTDSDCLLQNGKPIILMVHTYVGQGNRGPETDELDASLFISSFCSVLEGHSDEKLKDIFDRLTEKMSNRTRSVQKLIVSPPSMENFYF